MSRVVGVLVVLAAAGCAGRWLNVEQPMRASPLRPIPRDYRVVLKNDSVVVLHDAVPRNDSLVEVTEATPRGIDLMDAAQVEQWQPAGERVTGGIALGIFAGIVALLTAIGLALRD